MSLPLNPQQALGCGKLSFRELVVQTWNKTIENEIFTRASAVAFYAMLASVPFLGLLLTMLVRLLPDLNDLTGKKVGVANISVKDLEQTLKILFPKEIHRVVEDQIAHLQDQLRDHPPVWLFVFGIGSMLWLASSLYTAIIDSMNRIHGVVETRSIVRIRLVAVLMTVIQAAILLGALVAIVAGPEILRKLGFQAHEVELGRFAQLVVVWIMVLLSFALSFHVAPNASWKWRWITPGSLVGSLAFLAASYIFRIYVHNFANYDRAYGSLGGVMMLLFWLWVSSAVLLIAAQLNAVIEHASSHGQNAARPTTPAQPA